MQRLRVIGVEEHMWSPGIRDALMSLPYEQHGTTYTDTMTRMLDEWGEPRLRAMDAIGMDMQVLSVTTPATQVPELTDAVALARDANDLLARVVATHPERYQAFATLPTPDPVSSVEELERCVRELGHRGVMLHGRTGEKLIDHPDFGPIFDKAAELAVPIHLHPQRPIKAISDHYYMEGLPEMVGRIFSIAGWGWHMETAVNVIRLVLSGTFERAPDLQVILGHWGEMVPFFLERVDEMFSMLTRDAPRTFAETFVSHFHLAPAGIWSYPMLQHAIAEVGADRILYSVDYPFILPMDGTARRFLEEAPISTPDKHKIGHLNAERLLGLEVNNHNAQLTEDEI